MGHKCFISFKSEDRYYKEYIQDRLRIDMIDKSLDSPIPSHDEDYIMQKIREDYLSDSTVTIHLIGLYSAESRGIQEQRYIKRELQGSLFNGKWNTRNGILGIALPEVQPIIFKDPYYCRSCGGSHNFVAINDNTVVKEFSYNFYIPNGKCCHSENERYCVLTTWENFCSNPELYINQAYEKRTSLIAEKVRVYP
jgi:hypothetical protein